MEDRQEIMKNINKQFKTADSKEVKVLDYLSRMVHIIVNMQGPLLTMKLPEVCSEKILE